MTSRIQLSFCSSAVCLCVHYNTHPKLSVSSKLALITHRGTLSVFRPHDVCSLFLHEYLLTGGWRISLEICLVSQRI